MKEKDRRVEKEEEGNRKRKASLEVHQEKEAEKVGKDFRGGDNETLLEEDGWGNASMLSNEEMIAVRVLVNLRRPSHFPANPWVYEVGYPLPYLPFGIVYKILSQLPPRILGRMKLVCKEWRDLIDSSFFVLRLHLPFSRGARPCIPLRMRHSRSFFYVQYNSGIRNTLLDSNIHPTTDSSETTVLPLSTCNGLLFYVEEKLEVHGYRCYFYVVNPVTREKMQLPHIEGEHPEIEACQLLWEEEAGEWGVYKVFLIYRDMVPMALMFTLGVDSAWRRINNPYKYWRICSIGYFDDLDHPCIHGAIHRVYDNTIDCYYDERTDEEKPLKFVVAFDIREEMFREIKLPKECSLPQDKSSIGNKVDHWACHPHLIELGGHLCLLQLNIPKEALDAWLLIDYDKGTWMKHHSVSINSIVLGYRDIKVFAKISDERVLIELEQPHENGHTVLLSYNPQRMTLERVNILGICLNDIDCFLCGVFTESLVPLAPVSSGAAHASTPNFPSL